MPIPRSIVEFLDAHRVAYQHGTHPATYTAQTTAHAQHVSGRDLAKTVMVMADGNLLMAVCPASHHVDLQRLKAALKAQSIRLATEMEFGDKFPGCELGAMPPLGNLYHCDVWVDETVREHPDLVFNAGTHTDTISMAMADFEALVQPHFGRFAELTH